MRRRERSRADATGIAAELRRLRSAALFFGACVLVVVVLALVGLYH